MMRFGAILFAAAFSVQPLPQADGPLEPSVQNEVDHAIDKGERWLERVEMRRLEDKPPYHGRARPLDAPFVKGAGNCCAHDGRARCPQRAVTNDFTMAQLGLTNGQTRVEMALKLISSQRGGGWWLTETNAAPTRLAVEILKGL